LVLLDGVYRENMVPPPTALKQNAAIYAHKRQQAHQRQQPKLTVTPQLAYDVSSSVCTGLLNAVVHAWDQNADDMISCKGVEGCGDSKGAGCKIREVEAYSMGEGAALKIWRLQQQAVAAA
jgi:hypothetical protein